MRLKKAVRSSMPFVVLLALLASANAQGICVHDELVTQSLAGRVVAQLARGETPMPGASVHLLEDRYQGRVIAETTSDADGVFKFRKKMKPGKYVLKVTYPQLASYYGPLRLTKARTGSGQQEIVVTIGAAFNKPCGGSSALVRPVKAN